MIIATYAADTIVSRSAEAFELHEKSRLGEKKDDAIEYSAVEALYLAAQKKLVAYAGKKELTYDLLFSKIKKNDTKIATKIVVFTDLRKRGYIVKSALKFGAEFRIYNKGIKPGEDHARWVAYTTREHGELNWHEFAAKNRVAHAAKKNLLICVVDEEGDVSYYECGWIKP